MDAVALFIVTLLQMFLPPLVAVLVFAACAIGGVWLVEELSTKVPE